MPRSPKELPHLLAKHDPDAVLLFGLAGRSDRVRIETRAVNAASLIHPDAARSVPASRKLYPKAPTERFVRPEVRRLLAAARRGGRSGPAFARCRALCLQREPVHLSR